MNHNLNCHCGFVIVNSFKIGGVMKTIRWLYRINSKDNEKEYKKEQNETEEP